MRAKYTLGKSYEQFIRAAGSYMDEEFSYFSPIESHELLDLIADISECYAGLTRKLIQLQDDFNECTYLCDREED